MPESFNTSLKARDTRKIHFNKLDGTLNSTKNKIESFDPKKDINSGRILGTPIFGQDELGPYWSTNLFQITSTLGTDKDFKDLQVSLYKQGKGWIIDGAFVNEGLEGIHLKDVLKYGKESPFLYWFETHNFMDSPIKFGILPKNPEAQDKWDIRIVNDPTKDGYDKNKPTYIQLYDTRLASKEQVESNELIRVYDKKPENPNKIKTYMDSVHPYSFEVDPEELSEKLKIKDKDELKKALTKWRTFEIVRSDDDGGITLWSGNKDIAKLRFATPKAKLDALKDPEKVEQIKIAESQVQDNIVQAGRFWTEKVAKSLTEYTAKTIAKQLESSGDYAKAIEALAGNGLPAKAKMVLDKDDAGVPLDNLLKGSYSLKPTPLPENITDGLMSYPLEAIEFSTDLTSALSSPYIKKYAADKEDIGKSRYEISKDLSKIPAKFRDVYASMDNLYKGDMTDIARDILKKVDETRPSDSKLLDSAGNLTSTGKELFRFVADDIVRFEVAKALDPEINLEFNDEDIKKLKNINLFKLNISNSKDPKLTSQLLVNKLAAGLKELKTNEQDKAKLADIISERLKGIDENTVKVAKLIIDRTESGLEWRIDAAKDVGDIDNIGKDRKTDFAEVWQDVTDFWTKFVKEVRKYNPKAYMIGEVTDVPS